MKSVRELFFEVIEEAKRGKVNIDGEEFGIKFNTIIDEDRTYYDDEKYESLIIDDLDLFLIKLSEYIDLELAYDRRTMPIFKDKEDNKVKLLISSLFANASFKDFENPVEFLDKRINFLKDKTFDNFNDGVVIPLGDELYNGNLHIINEKDSVHSETPYKMTFYIEKDGDIYYLPSINYGIDNNTCYIYSMMNKNEGKNKDSKFAKDINRALYKLNEGIIDKESDEYREYLANGREGYYPENITDVSLPFVFSATIFMNLLHSKNIKDINIVTYLPVRYDSRDLASDKSDYKERNDRIQNNASNKLIRTFNRAISYMNGASVVSYPFDTDEYMKIKLDDELIINNEMLNDKVR